jgi:cobalt-zinc-cadmium resistance protein CzcA
VYGDDLDTLLMLGKEVEKLLQSVPGAADVKLEQATGLPVMTVTPKRDLLYRHGLNVADVQDLIETALGGKIAGQVFEGDRRFDLVVRLPEALRNNPAVIAGLPVPLPDGGFIPLRVGDHRHRARPQRHQPRKRQATRRHYRQRPRT